MKNIIMTLALTISFAAFSSKNYTTIYGDNSSIKTALVMACRNCYYTCFMTKIEDPEGCWYDGVRIGREVSRGHLQALDPETSNNFYQCISECACDISAQTEDEKFENVYRQ